MSNPYGGPPEPGEQPSYQPYETPYGGSPYGGSPYGGSPYGGAHPGSPAARSTDGVSIAGFVLSLLCCTSIVGLILGIVGIGRTKDGVRSGRWAAVSAIVIGAVGTLAFVGLLGFFVWFGTSTVLLDDAEPGQCVNVDEIGDGPDATLFKKDCTDDHDAEIVATGSFDRGQAADVDPGDPETVCAEEVEQEYAAVIAEDDYELGIVYESEDPDPGDVFVCYVGRADGGDLDESVAAD